MPDPGGQWPGPQVGVGKAELTAWWLAAITLLWEEPIAAEAPIAKIPRTNAWTTSFMMNDSSKVVGTASEVVVTYGYMEDYIPHYWDLLLPGDII